jgi:hypothetical protein
VIEMNATNLTPTNYEVTGPLSGMFSQIMPQTIISIALFIAIAINGLLFIPDPEKRCLKDVKMSGTDKLRIKLQEESKQQQPDVHTIHIGISGDNYIVIPQIFQIFLDI